MPHHPTEKPNILKINENPLLTYILTSNEQTKSESSHPHHEDITNYVYIDADYSKSDFSILPKTFEPHKTIWKNWLTPSKNQGSCGSCWGFATVSNLSDRINIQSRKRILGRMLSPALLILCDDLSSYLNNKNVNTIENPFELNQQTINNFACSGNYLISGALYLLFYGTSREKCFPYTISNQSYYKITNTNYGLLPYFNLNESKINLTDLESFSKDTNSGNCFLFNPLSNYPLSFCYSTISANHWIYGTPFQSFHALFIYNIKYCTQNIHHICYDIYKWGPLCSAFTIYQDFYEFDPKKDGVYIHDSKKYSIPLGGHAVNIVGWGIYEDKPFWWIKNSFGTSYGDNGYFRFFRGIDQCGIETNVLGIMPNLFYDFNDFSLIKRYHQKIQNLNIFQLNSNLPYYVSFIKKIWPSLSSNYKLITESLIQKFITEFGYFAFQVLFNIGYAQIDTLTKSGYNRTDLAVFPGLDYSCLDLKDPFDPTFLAGRPKKTNILMIIFLSFVLFLFIILTILWFLKK